MSFEKAGETGQTAENEKKGNPLETFNEMRKQAEKNDKKKVTERIKDSARKKAPKEVQEGVAEGDTEVSQEAGETAASRTKAQLEAKKAINGEIARIFEFKNGDGNSDMRKVKDEIEKSQKFLSELESNFTTDDPEMKIDLESLREYKKLNQEIGRLEDQKSKLESEDKIKEARKNIQRSGTSVEDPDNKNRNRVDIFTQEGEAFMMGGRDGDGEENDLEEENTGEEGDKDEEKPEGDKKKETDREGDKDKDDSSKSGEGDVLEKRKRNESASAEAYRKLTEKIEALYGCMNALDDDKELEAGQKALLDKLSVSHEQQAIKEKIVKLEEDRTILAGSMHMTGAGQDYRSMAEKGASAYEYYGNASETLAAAKTLEIGFRSRLERELPVSRRGAVNRFSNEVSEELDLRDRVVRGRDVSDIESKNTSDWWLMDKLLKLTGKEELASEIKNADNRGKCRHEKEDLGGGRYKFIIEWEDLGGQKKRLDIKTDIKDSKGTGTLRGLVWDRSKDRIVSVGVQESEIDDEESEEDSSPEEQEAPEKEVGGFKAGEYGFTGWEAGVFWKLARGQEEDDTRALRIILDKMNKKDQYFEEITGSKDAKFATSVHGKRIFFDVRWKDETGEEKNLMFIMTGEEPGGLRKRLGLVHEYPYQIEVMGHNLGKTDEDIEEEETEGEDKNKENETVDEINEKLKEDYPKTVEFLDFTLDSSPNSEEALLGVRGIQDLLREGKKADAAEQIMKSAKGLEEAAKDGSALDSTTKDKIADFIRLANDAVKELGGGKSESNDMKEKMHKEYPQTSLFLKECEAYLIANKEAKKIHWEDFQKEKEAFEKGDVEPLRQLMKSRKTNFISNLVESIDSGSKEDLAETVRFGQITEAVLKELNEDANTDNSGEDGQDEDSDDSTKETRESVDKLYGEKLAQGEKVVFHSGEKEYKLYYDNDKLTLEDVKASKKYVLDKDFLIKKGANYNFPLAGTYEKNVRKDKLKDSEGHTHAGTRQVITVGVIDKIEILRNAS